MALGALAGTALVAAGCGIAPAPRNALVVDTERDTETETEQDPDTALLASVVGEMDGVVALLEAVRRREPSQRRRVVLLLRVHAEHRELLDSAIDSSGSPSPRRPGRPPRRGDAAAEVTRRERQLAARLAEAAAEAESGTFARVLASMSASLHQHLEVA
jgi:hypothetical protein